MTRLLKQAVAQAAALPEAEQDSLAGRWLADLADEQGWQERFASSQDVLARLAEEAVAEHRAGLTEELEREQVKAQVRRHINQHGWDVADDEEGWRQYQQARTAKDYRDDDW